MDTRTPAQRRLDRSEANERTAADSVRFWVAVASGESREHRGERGAGSRKCPRKAKRGLSKARRRRDKAVIGVELND